MQFLANLTAVWRVNSAWSSRGIELFASDLALARVHSSSTARLTVGRLLGGRYRIEHSRQGFARA
jgi:hypothetical protein